MPSTTSSSLLGGRAVVVTDAGRGLGRAYAQHLAEHGARVVVNDVDAVEAHAVADGIGGSGERARRQRSRAIDVLMSACVSAHGRLDGLVNNAGLYHEAVPWAEEPEAIRRAVAVNVVGSLLCQSAASKIMRDQGGGAIVNASSGGMFGFPAVSTYAATKGALAALTYSSALDLESAGMRVNAISPMALTRMTHNALGRGLTPSTSDKAPLAGIEDKPPERIAPLVTFLLSELAEGITGQFFRFDGTRLSIVTTNAFADHPNVAAERWDLAAFGDALTGPLAGHRQLYGVERRLPPRTRT